MKILQIRAFLSSVKKKRGVKRAVKRDTTGYDRACGVICVSAALYNNRKASQIVLLYSFAS